MFLWHTRNELTKRKRNIVINLRGEHFIFCRSFLFLTWSTSFSLCRSRYTYKLIVYTMYTSDCYDNYVFYEYLLLCLVLRLYMIDGSNIYAVDCWIIDVFFSVSLEMTKKKSRRFTIEYGVFFQYMTFALQNQTIFFPLLMMEVSAYWIQQSVLIILRGYIMTRHLFFMVYLLFS